MVHCRIPSSITAAPSGAFGQDDQHDTGADDLVHERHVNLVYKRRSHNLVYKRCSYNLVYKRRQHYQHHAGADNLVYERRSHNHAGTCQQRAGKRDVLGCLHVRTVNPHEFRSDIRRAWCIP